MFIMYFEILKQKALKDMQSIIASSYSDISIQLNIHLIQSAASRKEDWELNSKLNSCWLPEKNGNIALLSAVWAI